MWKKKYKKCYSARRADKKCYTIRRDISRKIFTEFFHFFRETINYGRLKLFWVNSIFNKNCTFVRKVHEIRSLAHSCPKHVVIEKKSPSTFDNKIVNCSHQTTIFHWNWKEKLRFVGGLVVHLQKFPPNLGRIGCVS